MEENKNIISSESEYENLSDAEIEARIKTVEVHIVLESHARE